MVPRMHTRDKQRAHHRRTWYGQEPSRQGSAYQTTLQGQNVRYLEADSRFGQYTIGDAKERQQQIRTLLDADLRVLDDLFPARRISDASGEQLQPLVPALLAHAQHRGDPQTGRAGWASISATTPWGPQSLTD
jgi:hypothetical protein